jgi:hypothetical protein
MNKMCSSNVSNMEKIKFSLECFKYKLETDLRFTIETVSFVFLCLAVISINMIVIITTLKNKERKPIDLCFLSNSFSDLIMGSIVIPVTAVYTLFGHFPFPLTVCYIWSCLDFTIGTVSMLHISYISYDRFLAGKIKF